jgi:hypothetical protein
MVGNEVGNLTLVLDVRVAPAIRGKKLPSPSKPYNQRHENSKLSLPFGGAVLHLLLFFICWQLPSYMLFSIRIEQLHVAPDSYDLLWS